MCLAIQHNQNGAPTLEVHVWRQEEQTKEPKIKKLKLQKWVYYSKEAE